MNIKIAKYQSAGDPWGIVLPPHRLSDTEACRISVELCSRDKAFGFDKVAIINHEVGAHPCVEPRNASGNVFSASFASLFCAVGYLHDHGNAEFSQIEFLGERFQFSITDALFSRIPTVELSPCIVLEHPSETACLRQFSVAGKEVLAEKVGNLDSDSLLRKASQHDEARKNGYLICDYSPADPWSAKALAVEASQGIVLSSVESAAVVAFSLWQIAQDKNDRVFRIDFPRGRIGCRIGPPEKTGVSEASVSLLANSTRIFDSSVRFDGRLIQGESFSGEFDCESVETFLSEMKSLGIDVLNAR